MERGTCRRRHEAAVSAPFRAPVDRHLSRARLAGPLPCAFAVPLVAAAGRGANRGRRRPLFGRRHLPWLENAAFPKCDLARFRRARGGVLPRGGLAKGPAWRPPPESS